MIDQTVQAQRNESLARYDILDSERESEYDDIAKIACTILAVSSSMITLRDTDGQWFKSEIGLGVSF